MHMAADHLQLVHIPGTTVLTKRLMNSGTVTRRVQDERLARFFSENDVAKTLHKLGARQRGFQISEKDPLLIVCYEYSVTMVSLLP